MRTDQDIKAAQDRVMGVFARKPEAALGSKHGVARVGQGLTCTYGEGDREAVMDMPAPVGGSEAGPSPGFHARASVAGCVAIGIRMTAIRLGIPLDGVEVGVEMEFDDSAILGMGQASAAPLVTRLEIRLDTDADRESRERLLATALAADPYYLALRDPQRVEVQLVEG